MSRQKKQKRKKTAGDYFLTLVLLVAIGAFCFAGFNLIHIYLEYKKGTDEYAALEEMAVTEREPDSQKEQTGENPGEGNAAYPQPPITVDFAPLRQVNEEVIGWIYVEGIPSISYPVVKGSDNDYYLHRTYEGTYNFAGTIFLDYENKGDFSDCNTIVYGHNMQNGSMFGHLNQFTDGDAYEKSKYFWILTPDKNYRYQIFAAYRTGVASDTYTLFMGPGDEFLEYANKMKTYTEIQTEDVEMGVRDKIVTLSTCTGNESTRLVVQGKMVDAVPVSNS